MRILVTGGAGTVGAALTAILRKKGQSVISCDRRHAAREMAFSVGMDEASPAYVRCDIGEFRQLARVFDSLGPFDYVYHCAAEFGRWNGEDFYEDLWRTNVIGTKHLIRLQERLGFRLIHFSSSEVYGDWPGLMVETTLDNHEVKHLNDYAMTKWVNEMQLRNSRLQSSTEFVVVRLFNTFGPGEYYSPYRSVNCRFLYCALHGLPWTVFRGHSRTSTFLADAVQTLANIVDNFRPGETYNIASGHHHTIEELSALVIKVTGVPENLVRWESAEHMTTRHKLVDTTKARRDLGHRDSHSLEEGLRLTAAWMREVYDLNAGHESHEPRRSKELVL